MNIIRKIDPQYYILIASFIVMTVVFILRISSLPPQVPLFYSQPTGDDQMADTFWIFILPILSLIFVGINKWLFARYFTGKILLFNIMFVTNIAIIILTTFIFVRVLLLVT